MTDHKKDRMLLLGKNAEVSCMQQIILKLRHLYNLVCLNDIIAVIMDSHTTFSKDQFSEKLQ